MISINRNPSPTTQSSELPQPFERLAAEVDRQNGPDSPSCLPATKEVRRLVRNATRQTLE
ncbi:MAG: hypothetical protein PHW10_06140 [Candidatus Peribacteraceae bacterium]|nr:hypothetical protein [Candidatus Peribacteraceae bacterium]